MPEVTEMVPLGDREVEMRKPTEGALVVLARITRTLPKIENNATEADVSQEVRDKLLRNLGTLGNIVEAMIVQADDRDWLEDQMIGGGVSAGDVFDSIRVAGEKFNGAGAPARPVKKAAAVRRRR
jgi:hypothetical protein